MHRFRSFAAVLLVVALLLSGCKIAPLSSYTQEQPDSAPKEDKPEFVRYTPMHYKDMVYSRPDMEAMEKALRKAIDTAGKTESVYGVLNAVNGFLYAYDDFYTSHTLSYLRYSADLTSIFWKDEYDFCAQNLSQADAYLDELYYALAACPTREKLEEKYFGEGFFDYYDTEQSIWDEEYMALLEQETQLLGNYYTLSDQLYNDPNAVYDELAQLLTDLIRVRQQIAAYASYDSYPEFAYDCRFYRDYTPAQAESYCTAVGQALRDVYIRVNENEDTWQPISKSCGKQEAYEYVRNAADAMDGIVEDAFDYLDTYGLYDMEAGENRYAASFEVYLWSYVSPFIFLHRDEAQTDKLSFAHEFGHFANEYICGGSYAGADVAEVHSQAFEYLSLCCTEDSDVLRRYKLADSLCIYMEQAAYALFEQQAYRLTADELTAENVAALYKDICLSFGFDSWDWDPRDFVAVSHFYEEPMYMMSYVVSNDLAMQLYQLELESPGDGVELYRQCLLSEDSYILEFAEAYGLESPFLHGRLLQLQTFFEEQFP